MLLALEVFLVPWVSVLTFSDSLEVAAVVAVLVDFFLDVADAASGFSLFSCPF